MPSVGDIIRVVLTFTAVEGGLMQNIYHILLTQVLVAEWDSVAGAAQAWFVDMYDDYFQDVNNQVGSTTIELLQRDTVAGQWNTVLQRSFVSVVGQTALESLPSINTATVVAFPEIPRYWGFKSLPAPSEAATANGILLPSVLANLLLFAGHYTAGRVGATISFTSGVYSEATETYRPFTSSIKLTDIIGSRVTRKTGRGI